jgi:hypothetical protein
MVLRDRPGSPPTDASADLAARLAAVAGGDLEEIELTTEQLADWNEAITAGTRSSSEHRILLGLAIASSRPEHGRVGEFHAAMGQALNRSDRWIRETVRVSAVIGQAIVEGVALPVELCDMSWGRIPHGIDNLRKGRPVDWKPEKSDEPPSPEEQADAVAKALAALDRALSAVQADEQRAVLIGEILDHLRGFVAGDE